MTKFRGKYRIESARLKDWNYDSPGYYFVTICTQNGELFFCQIAEGEICLSHIGEIVEEEWQRTEHIRADISLDEWVIMPNHLHGIIIIHESSQTLVETFSRNVSTNTIDMNNVPRLKSNTLGAIIGQIKSKCTKRIRAAGYPEFAWQARFHDHIIRDQKSLEQIRHYIRYNPEKWIEDEYFPGDKDL